MGKNKVDERARKLAASSAEVVLRPHVEPKDDMLRERARATFNSNELAAYVNGGQEILDKR